MSINVSSYWEDASANCSGSNVQIMISLCLSLFCEITDSLVSNVGNSTYTMKWEYLVYRDEISKFFHRIFLTFDRNAKLIFHDA